MTGSVIKATGTAEFEDGLCIGNYLQARNGLQRVRTIRGVGPGEVHTPIFLRGRLNSNLPGSAWVLGVVEPGARFDSQKS